MTGVVTALRGLSINLSISPSPPGPIVAGSMLRWASRQRRYWQKCVEASRLEKAKPRIAWPDVEKREIVLPHA